MTPGRPTSHLLHLPLEPRVVLSSKTLILRFVIHLYACTRERRFIEMFVATWPMITEELIRLEIRYLRT